MLGLGKDLMRICGQIPTTGQLIKLAANSLGSLITKVETVDNNGFIQSRVVNFPVAAGVSTVVYTFTAQDLPVMTITNTGANAAWLNFGAAAALGNYVQIGALGAFNIVLAPEYITSMSGITVNIFSAAGTTITISTLRKN